jgi:hypothetical protein
VLAEDDSLSEEVELGSSVHLSFDGFKSYVESGRGDDHVSSVMTTELRRWLERHGGADGEVAGAGAAMYGRASLDLLPKASHLGLAPTNLTFGDLITKLAPEPRSLSGPL